jgi:hypothetical protein
MGMSTNDAAQKIRNGKITREESMGLIRRYCLKFLTKFFREILEYMNISKECFWEVRNAAHLPNILFKIQVGIGSSSIRRRECQTMYR